MPNVPVTFSGDASGVAAAAAAAQAAIDSVHGKTETVDINVRVNGARDAAAALDQHGAAAARAAAGARDHASASERASASVRDHASATERASSATRDHGSASMDASRSLDRHTQATARAGAGMERVGRNADHASGSLGGFARSGDTASRATGVLGRSIDDLGDSVSGASGGVSGLTKGIGSLTEASSTVNLLGTASQAVRMFGTAAVYGAAGSGILTAAVGALGAVGVGALGGVGVAAGLAGAGMASFAADSLKDSAKFANAFKSIGQTAHLASQYVSEPVGDAMVSMAGKLANNGALTQAGLGIANSLRDGFGEAAGVVTKNSDAIVGAAGEAAAGFSRLTGEVAPGVSAFLGQLPGLTTQAVSGMSQITSEFGNSARQIEGAVPSFGRVMSAAGGMGAELVSIGARSMVPFNEDVTSMVRGATRMANQLEPAIKPSMSAFTDLANAGTAAIGSLSPQISDFANTVSQDSPQIRSALTGVGQAMFGLGQGAVQGLAEASPALQSLGATTQRYAPAIGRDTGRAGGVLADFLGGAEQMLGWGAETGESTKSFGDNLLGTTRDSSGRITGWGRSALGGPARSTWGYVGGTGPQGDPGGVQGGAGSTAGGVMAGRAGMVPAPVAAAPRAFIGPVAPMPETTAGLFTGAAAAQHAGAGSVGSAMQSVIRKTVSQNIPAAEAGGAAIGGAMASGTATGVTSTQTVTDTVMRKHIKHMIDVGQQEGDIHSPSRKTRRMLGQPLGEGTALGVQDTFGVNRDAMGGLLGHYGNENTPAPVINIRGGKRPAKMAQDAAAPGAEGGMIRGQAKQVQFGEDPNAVGSKGDAARAVFDKQVMSWDAKPGVDITQIHDMGELNAAIQSPLSGRQYTALNSMQGILDQPGLTRNSQMFGERTEQNIMRNRSGAFDVAGQWADHVADQKDQARELGAALPGGVAQGVNDNAQQPANAIVDISGNAQNAFKKHNGINSPSTVYAGYGFDQAAGVGVGYVAGAPAATEAMTSASGTMADVVGGYLSDRGLMAGYAWAENVETGASSQIKKADYKALGLPQLGAAAKTSLAATGLLSAGSGASSYKTPGNTPGFVTLAPASIAQQQTIVIQPQHIYIDGNHIATIADERFMVNLEKIGDSIQLQPSG